MRIDKTIFEISQLSHNSIRIIKVKKDIEKIKENTIEELKENKTILILIGNENIEVIRNNKSLTLFSAGIITERIISLCKKDSISYSLSLGFNEENIRKIIQLPRFMNIITIISIEDIIESDYEFIYDNRWVPKD